MLKICMPSLVCPLQVKTKIKIFWISKFFRTILFLKSGFFVSNLIFRVSRSFWCIITLCISCSSARRSGRYKSLSFIEVCICHFQPEILFLSFLSFFAKTQFVLFSLTDAKDLRETTKTCWRCPRASLTLE